MKDEELKYDIIEKSLNAALKSKVLMFTNNNSDIVIRIPLRAYNYKDFIYNLNRKDFINNSALEIFTDIVEDYLTYITGFFISVEAVELVKNMLGVYGGE